MPQRFGVDEAALVGLADGALELSRAGASSEIDERAYGGRDRNAVAVGDASALRLPRR
jgi:hypothetical protein